MDAEKFLGQEVEPRPEAWKVVFNDLRRHLQIDPGCVEQEKDVCRVRERGKVSIYRIPTSMEQLQQWATFRCTAIQDTSTITIRLNLACPEAVEVSQNDLPVIIHDLQFPSLWFWKK